MDACDNIRTQVARARNIQGKKFGGPMTHVPGRKTGDRLQLPASRGAGNAIAPLSRGADMPVQHSSKVGLAQHGVHSSLGLPRPLTPEEGATMQTSPITLTYAQPKGGRRGEATAIGAILLAKENLLGWGVSEGDGIEIMMARRYLRDTYDRLAIRIQTHPGLSGRELSDAGVFDDFQVHSQGRHWRVSVTVPKDYHHKQLVKDNLEARQRQEAQTHG